MNGNRMRLNGIIPGINTAIAISLRKARAKENIEMIAGNKVQGDAGEATVNVQSLLRNCTDVFLPLATFGYIGLYLSYSIS